jgi:hypothetical protein
MGFNDLLRSIFQGVAEAKQESYYPRRFRELETSRLLEVDELEDMLQHARSKEQLDLILDHLYRFDACELGEFGYYKKIERKIIERLW